MEDQIDLAVKMEAVRKMKKPEINMHPCDLEALHQLNRSRIADWVRPSQNFYGSIPIVENELIAKGTFIIIDSFVY